MSLFRRRTRRTPQQKADIVARRNAMADKKRAERIANAIEGYKGTGYCFCESLIIYAEKLVAEWHKDYSITDFCEDMQNRMWELWFEDNRYHFSKENFLEMIEANDYEFDQDGNLF